MTQTNTQIEPPRAPVEPDERFGYFLASGLWVLLTFVVAFFHHYLVSVGDTHPSIKEALMNWIVHSALGYLLLITIVVDVVIDMHKSRVNHKLAWQALAAIVIVLVCMIGIEMFAEDWKVVVWLSALLASFIAKFYSLREYTW